MKKVILFYLVFWVVLLVACSNETNYYAEHFEVSSDNWEVSLNITQLSSEKNASEEIEIEFKYINQISGEMPFSYEIRRGSNPSSAFKSNTLKISNGMVRKESLLDQNFVETLINEDTLTLVIHWQGDSGELGDEFIFQDLKNVK
jgi:hypothetical protein